MLQAAPIYQQEQGKTACQRGGEVQYLKILTNQGWEEALEIPQRQERVWNVGARLI